MNNQKIYLWIQHYKEIGLSILPKENQFDNIFRERMLELSKDRLVCFKRIVMTSLVSCLFPRWLQVV